MLQKPNVLVLDEPTNHLDLESINALNIALQKYDGTVLLVTHDHDVIDEVATRIWHFEGGRVEDFRVRTRNIWCTRRKKLRSVYNSTSLQFACDILTKPSIDDK